MKKTHYTDAQKSEILNYRKDHTLAETSKAYGVSIATLSNWATKSTTKKKMTAAKKTVTKTMSTATKSKINEMFDGIGTNESVFQAVFSLGLAAYGSHLLASVNANNQ